MIVCAGNNETFSFATAIGVGLIESASRLTQLILEKHPASITFVGSAGSYGDVKPFDIFESHDAANIELSFLQHTSYTPIAQHIQSQPFLVPRETKSVFVNSSNYITTDMQLAKELLSKGYAIENMEFFAIVCVAKRFNLPCSGYFIVTNYCNTNAHQDFLNNHHEAKVQLSDYIKTKVIC